MTTSTLFDSHRRLTLPNYAGVLIHYKELLPVTDKTPMITLGEGNTALVRADSISQLLKTQDVEVWLKLESENRPTGTFKDRGMVVAVAKAVEEGKELLICASTGNTSASAAAYGAYARQHYGVKRVLVVVSNDAAEGKVLKAVAYGATVVRIAGNFDEALKAVRAIAENNPKVGLMNSTNPHRLQGQKTASFEVCDALGRAPDYHFVPVGNAGNITAYWMGYKQYRERGLISSLPRMMGYQAEGADPIVKGRIIENLQTKASAIRIGNPASWEKAVIVKDESGGVIQSVTDEEMGKMQYFLSAESGLSILVELASAASATGLLKADRSNLLKPGTLAVCVLTGYGTNDAAVLGENVKLRNPIETVDGGSGLEGVVEKLLSQK